MDPWLEIDTTTWPFVTGENRGTRPKAWLGGSDGASWLRKTPRPARDGVSKPRDAELAIEAFALRLARASGLDAPESAVTTWVEEPAEERRGVVVRNFLGVSEELSAGSQLLSRFFPEEYDPTRHELHTLERVRSVLETLEPESRTLVAAFANLLAFDAWVGNGDRHQGNWGIIRAPGQPVRLAPLYDPAASLGSELADNDRRLANPAQVPEKYVLRCPSGFGDGRDLIRQPAVVAQVREWPEWQANVGAWLASFDQVRQEADGLLERIPEKWLSLQRKTYARELLKARLEWLRRAA